VILEIVVYLAVVLGGAWMLYLRSHIGGRKDKIVATLLVICAVGLGLATTIAVVLHASKGNSTLVALGVVAAIAVSGRVLVHYIRLITARSIKRR